MYSDAKRLHATDPGTVEGNPVFEYHDAFNPDKNEINELKERYRAGRVGDVEVKTKLSTAINNMLEPFRERRAYYTAHPNIAQDIVTQGIRRMQIEARETMDIVRNLTGLSYSTDMFADEIDLFGEYDG
jgi:tryptophanyl-tRNA synthetase